jgi:phosphoglycolate phosphatase-like HAD superfamily hydrolase
MFTTFFFDMDGTLFDSMPMHAQCWEKAMGHYGFQFPQRDVYLNEGRTGQAVIDEFFLTYHNRHATSEEIDEDVELAPEVLDRLDTYADKAESVIDKMFDIMRSIDSFEPLEQNASEMEREKRSQQALAINNKATLLNRKAIGIFHPMAAREAHSELVQASETIRSASHTLYSYCLLEDPQEAMKKYTQARDLIVIAKRHIEKFNKIIQNLTNTQPQQ